METVKIFAGNSSNGNRVYEQLPATGLGDFIFRIEASPGLALGIAKGDEIQVDLNTGDYNLVRRGGNLSIQVYVSSGIGDSLSKLRQTLESSLGASLDGLNERQAVFSVSVEKGFQAIESLLNEFVKNNPKAEWYYGNVYDSDGITPLNWWVK